MIYNTGTISINGNTATGTGTNWTAPASQVRVSQTIIVLSNPVQMFQITAINSGTSLTVTPAASPALSGQKYGILVTDSLSVDGLAQSMSQFINEYDENIGAWETFASTSANQLVTVTINGTSLSIPAIGGLARKGANSDITELKGLTTALSIAQGGTGAKTAADARTNLSLGSSSTADTQTSSTDTSSGRVLKVGAFGLGANTITPPADTYTGFFSQGIGGNTNPDSVYGYAHLVMSVSGTYRTRMA
ncbi:phage tail protein, partial [Pseudocitrobacter sp. 2023EL-00150]|nr:phage tail protein [Pseudocitrobacter sp. 2023EL-00150]